MHSEFPPHEKIRFRRGDIACLDDLPSAVPPPEPSRARTAVRRTAKTFGACLFLVFLLAILAVGALWLGAGNERLRIEAQAAVQALLGADFDAAIGGTSVSFGDLGRPTIEVSDARLRSVRDQSEVMGVGHMRFGLRILPLLTGRAQLGNVAFSDARIEMAAMPRTDGGIGLAVFDDSGLLDVDVAMAALFEGAQRFIESAARSNVDHITLENIELVLGEGEGARILRVDEALIRSSPAGRLTMTASVGSGDRIAKVEAEATRDNRTGLIGGLHLRISADEQTITEGVPRNFDSGELLVSGSQRPEGNVFTFRGQVKGLELFLGGNDRIAGDVNLSASVAQGTNKIEIENIEIATGRSNWKFNGAIGPTPAAAAIDGIATYRFELVSDGSTVAPEASQEPTLNALARVAGFFAPSQQRLSLNEIGVRTGQGELKGTAAVQLEQGKSPGLELNLDLAQMPVGHVKQLWPWFAAPGARNWVVANVYGGTVDSGAIRLSVPPGRMGNGVPFGPAEVSGEFTIRGTRFDVAGRIPPVRDGNGAVAFRGTDVDISLESGSVFMANGRSVAAQAGTLTIRDAHQVPVIGKLDIGVEGAADAVLQLARYDPINVERYIDIAPSGISGQVKGRIQADIPLSRNIPVETLGWHVALDYTGLSLGQPFEGQRVTDATGSIVVDPQSATIKANARLNGAQATLDLIEPLGQSTVARRRLISLQLDDKAREAIAPGLDTVLSGTARVDVDDSTRDRRLVKASLDRATLQLPWVGWSKGSGVGGDVQFQLNTEGDRTELSDFRLSGESFGATGSISLSKGEVVRARFPAARLNRGDDFSVDVQAQGGGYAVTIRGRSIDARSIVKLYAQDARGGTAEGRPVPVNVDLEVDRLTGFHGAAFSNVRLRYAGTGARTDMLQFSAVSPNGTPVSFSDGRDGNRRSVTMNSADAGTLLKFLDIYENMEGGTISMGLAGVGDGPLRGRVDARDFWLVNEPRLSSIVSTSSPQSGRSLNEAVRGEIDTSRVQFERGFAQIEKGQGYLHLDSGILRGPLVGVTYQGTLYDRNGNMAMTGTFMPAYGLNRIFAEIPIIGQILGNGRDRGLIGITFRLAGSTDAPQLEVNPLSVIAPGIFRSVFEYR